MGVPPNESVELRVLVLAPSGRDAALACEVLQSAGVAAESAPTLAELCARLVEGAGAVVLTQEALQPPGFALLARTLSGQPPWSDLPVLVFSSRESGGEAATDRRAALEEIANLIFLDRPTRRVALLSAVHAALRARRRQYEVRDLLFQLQKAVRDRDQFLAMLGHELRNPLERDPRLGPADGAEGAGDESAGGGSSAGRRSSCRGSSTTCSTSPASRPGRSCSTGGASISASSSPAAS